MGMMGSGTMSNQMVGKNNNTSVNSSKEMKGMKMTTMGMGSCCKM